MNLKRSSIVFTPEGRICNVSWESGISFALLGVVFLFACKSQLLADAMQSRDWDELRRLMSIARQQNLLGEALQAVEQGPLAPIPRAKPKPKAKCMAAMSGGAGTGGMLEAALDGMTDASKRRLPDDDEDWEAVEGQEPLASTADVAAFLEANNVMPVPWEPMDGGLSIPVVSLWFPEIAIKMWTKGSPYQKGCRQVASRDPRW